MERISSVLVLFLSTFVLLAQKPKKPLDEEAYFTWNNIEHVEISNNGQWISYEINPNKGDGSLVLYDVRQDKSRVFPRGKGAQFDFHNNFLVFLSYPPQEVVDSLRRKKIKAHKLPTDTLKIIPLNGDIPVVVGDVTSFTLPRQWGTWMFYEMEARDSSWRTVRPRKPSKKESILVQRNLNSGQEDTTLYALDFAISCEVPEVFIIENTLDSLDPTHISYFDLLENNSGVIFEGNGTYHHLVTSDPGGQLSFIFRPDSSADGASSNDLLYWDKEISTAASLLEDHTIKLLDHENISEFLAPYFSKSGTKLFFGISPMTLDRDTTLLPEEVIEVEIWSYRDERLYTQQEITVNEDKERSFLCSYDFHTGTAARLATEEIPVVIPGNEGDASKVVGLHSSKYEMRKSWEGRNFRDLFIIDNYNGNNSLIASEISGQVKWSPDGNYVYWFEYVDTAWYCYNVEEDQLKQLTDSRMGFFADELNDIPLQPDDYGVMGWSENDQHIYIYDRYDIWQFSPDQSTAPRRITRGRESATTYRYVQLDPEERGITNKIVLGHCVNELTKEEGYVQLDLQTGEINQLLNVDKKLSNKPLKAKNADKIIYTEETFRQFPNLVLTNSNFDNPKTISNANPQQKEYLWGNAELVSWTTTDGIDLKGLLIKPENFDPTLKYPMIVNFYERSSEKLFTHRTPAPHRSTINYSYYASNGYLIFNPDVIYDIGYPGESALRSVVSGTNYIIEKGFVDEMHIGLQGHSWGGYQIAYIITQTDMFSCAEAGAPVVNMVSAYGGIRWGSGMSRMFQYEKTQSRLGATLWEKPELYLENSPIFKMDKINTPTLILHNDGDTAVPWYQGIEFFVALRRLNKPAWLLNYNDEPHWPLKWQNRIDFNKRMFQFFQHYLKEAPLPMWMHNGIPAVEKGINLGYELLEKNPSGTQH